MIYLVFRDSKLIVFKDDTNKWLAFGTLPTMLSAEKYLRREARRQVIFDMLVGQVKCDLVTEVADWLARVDNTPKFDYYFSDFEENDLAEVLERADAFLAKQEDEL